MSKLYLKDVSDLIIVCAVEKSSFMFKAVLFLHKYIVETIKFVPLMATYATRKKSICEEIPKCS